MRFIVKGGEKTDQFGALTEDEAASQARGLEFLFLSPFCFDKTLGYYQSEITGAPPGVEETDSR